MLSTSVQKNPNPREPYSIVKGFYESETPRSVLIRLTDRQSFWFPKIFIYPNFTPHRVPLQDFKIDNGILKRFKLIL